MRMIIDITQLASWTGKLTGIPRVMYELSSRYSQADNKTIFIIWNSQFNYFEEVDFNEIKVKRQQIGIAVVPAQVSVQTYSFVEHLIKKLYNSLPLVVKNTVRSIKHSVNQSVSVADHSQLKAFKFQSNDKLLIIWGEWGDQKYRTALTSAVAESTLCLYQFVHDMLPLVTPQYSAHSTEGLEKYTSEIYPMCSALISISRHTKGDVVEWLNTQKLTVPPIHIVRLGEDFEKKEPMQPNNAFFTFNIPYVLCVGTIESRKNHTLLYYTYKLAKTRGIELPPIVIVGRRGWLTENIYDLITNDPQTKGSFIFLHDASDEELAWIYKNSKFSIYPSHYEGWGLPIAESISYGVPVIASNVSSMPEVAGDLISYFSPVSTDECLVAITNLLDKNTLQMAREKLRKYKPTSWDETFKQTHAIIGDNNE